MKKWWIQGQAWFASALALMILVNARADSGAPELKRLERSFSLHASLGSRLERDSWVTNFPSANGPTEAHIRNAARLLTFDYAANRLYLIYQKEMSLPEAERVFRIWREACPVEVELVPALLLRTTNRTEIFNATQLRALVSFFKKEINSAHLAVLHPDSTDSTSRLLGTEYGEGLIGLGLAPEEPLAAPFQTAVADASSALSRGSSNEEWQQPGSGQETLRKLIQTRNAAATRITWDLLIADETAAGSAKNGPLVAGRNGLATAEILHFAMPNLLGGFSTDLQSLQWHSRTLPRDGTGYSFYEMLKRGQVYVGYYAKPFHEVVKIYQTLRAGKRPETK